MNADGLFRRGDEIVYHDMSRERFKAELEQIWPVKCKDSDINEVDSAIVMRWIRQNRY